MVAVLLKEVEDLPKVLRDFICGYFDYPTYHWLDGIKTKGDISKLSLSELVTYLQSLAHDGHLQTITEILPFHPTEIELLLLEATRMGALELVIHLTNLVAAGYPKRSRKKRAPWKRRDIIINKALQVASEGGHFSILDYFMEAHRGPRLIGHVRHKGFNVSPGERDTFTAFTKAVEQSNIPSVEYWRKRMRHSGRGVGIF